jgi:hypothetical protein
MMFAAVPLVLPLMRRIRIGALDGGHRAGERAHGARVAEEGVA